MKISQVRTYRFEQLPKLLTVELLTGDGLRGFGDTWHAPLTVEAHVHGSLAPRLIGAADVSVLGFWEAAWEAAARTAGRGAEIRALSAVDIALWDLLAQECGKPVHETLGGPIREALPVYNTCAGATYSHGGTTPGWGSSSGQGRLDDYARFLEDPAGLARELLDQGYRGMKLWPFDAAARQGAGRPIPWRDLEAGIHIVGAIREAVGDGIEIMIEGHGFWDLPSAVRIARALEPFRPAWIEDLMPSDDIGALRELTDSTSIPTVAGEYLDTRHEVRRLLEARAATILMFDPGWCGGISEARSIAALADAFSTPVTMHDCAGPFALLAGIHVGMASRNAIYQETVRAYLELVYPEMVTGLPRVTDGLMRPPATAGIGARLVPGLEARPGVSVRVTT